MNEIFNGFEFVHNFLVMTSTLSWSFGLDLLSHLFENKKLFVVFMDDFL